MSPHATRTPIKDRFKGKVALVTGGTNGIGHAIALELLREGAEVAVSCLPADVEEGRASFSQAGFSPLIIAGDMSNEEFCKKLVADTVAKFGRLDCLVNNAFSFIAKGLDATRKDFLYSLEVGPLGFALMIQLASEEMKKVGGGAVGMFRVSPRGSHNPTAGPTTCPRGGDPAHPLRGA